MQATPDLLAAGKTIFTKQCAPCHGTEGKGDGSQQQVDSEGYKTRPRDLTQGIFKGSPEPEEVYRRIVGGMPGTPMPTSDWAIGDDGWHLTNYVLAMSSEDQRERVEMKKYRIAAPKVDFIPDHPDAGVWEGRSPDESPSHAALVASGQAGDFNCQGVK